MIMDTPLWIWIRIRIEWILFVDWFIIYMIHLWWCLLIFHECLCLSTCIIIMILWWKIEKILVIIMMMKMIIYLEIHFCELNIIHNMIYPFILSMFMYNLTMDSDFLPTAQLFPPPPLHFIMIMIVVECCPCYNNHYYH